MISVAKLKNLTLKDLAAMARKQNIPGWHDMRKEQLLRALLRRSKTAAASSASRSAANEPGKRRGAVKLSVARAAGNGSAKSAVKGGSPKSAANGKVRLGGKAASRTKPSTVKRDRRVERRLQEIKVKAQVSKDLSFHSVEAAGTPVRDRLVVMVRDPYWLHAYWELSRKAIERAQVAMGQHWHGARPVLRLTEVSRDGTTPLTREVVRHIEIHGGVNNWYIDVQNPPKSYQLEIGYLASDGRFHSLARSNVVTTPAPGSQESFDKNWADVAKDFDRIYALSGGYEDRERASELKEVLEERLRRPVGEHENGRYTIAGPLGGQKKPFQFQVDTELIVHGVAEPDARVTLRGEPVPVRADGTFAVRFNLPDRRHVLPLVASSRDGAEQRTIVLAVDRNTKVMEPVSRDSAD